MQARSAHSLKVQGWLREEALEWGIRIDADIAAKEKDTEQIKQERQRDPIKLKVPLNIHIMADTRDIIAAVNGVQALSVMNMLQAVPEACC